MGTKSSLWRRGFLLISVGGAAASTALVRAGSAAQLAANDKVTLGFIGVGVCYNAGTSTPW